MTGLGTSSLATSSKRVAHSQPIDNTRALLPGQSGVYHQLLNAQSRF